MGRTQVWVVVLVVVVWCSDVGRGCSDVGCGYWGSRRQRCGCLCSCSCSVVQVLVGVFVCSAGLFVIVTVAGWVGWDVPWWVGVV